MARNNSNAVVFLLLLNGKNQVKKAIPYVRNERIERHYKIYVSSLLFSNLPVLFSWQVLPSQGSRHEQRGCGEIHTCHAKVVVSCLQLYIICSMCQKKKKTALNHIISYLFNRVGPNICIFFKFIT